jgi:DNA-binding XRE family transcriptional regulator
MKKIWDRPAMRFASARYVHPQEMLDVTFENGDHFLIAVESLLSQPAIGVPAEWANLRIGETGDVLELPAPDTVIEIPWDRIRSIVDPDFRALLADGSTERARRIGTRIRTMRLEANLTRPELAAKVGVPAEVVASLEAGKLEPPIDLIEHLALALGKRLRDFAQE